MAMRRITKIGKRKVRITVPDWLKLLALVGAELRRRRARIEELEAELAHRLGGVELADVEAELEHRHAAAGGGGCDGFCDEACAGHDGCDFSFGDAGECGGACNDGEVFLELEA
jgi:hypothetical protein